jgi:hypothetical protein
MTTDYEPDEQTDAADEEERGPKGLRDAKKRADDRVAELEAENNKLRSQLMTGAFKEAGLDTSTGIGKAVSKLYEGAPDPTEIREFAASEFDWKPSGTVAPKVTQPDAVLSEAVAASAPVGPAPDVQEQITQAERDGDWGRALALKTQMLGITAQQ